MAERGKSKYAYLASGSNNVVKTGPGTLYGIHGVLNSGGQVRIDDSHSFPQGVLNINATSSNTIGLFSTTGSITPGIAFDTGLAVAFSSNTLGLTIQYE